MKRIAWAAMVLLAAVPSLAGTRDKHAPRFELPGLSGTVVSDSLRGQVVLVDFWASWCVPCQRSFPWMSELQRRHAADGLKIVAIDLDKERDAADEFLARHPASFAVAFDPTGKVAQAFHVPGMPTSFLVGRDGTILESHIGFDPRKTGSYEAAIQEALKR